MCINVAAALIVLQAVRGISVDGRRHHGRGSEPGAGTGGETGDDPATES
jgi:hypothetical protein